MDTIDTAGWRTGYDAVTTADMPQGEFHYLYNDGAYKAPPEAYVQFSHGEIATVCIEATTVANEIDYENGNPDDVVTWARMMREDYAYDPVVYCDEESVTEVLGLFGTAGEPPPLFRIAAWGQQPEDVQDYGAGTVAVQWKNTPGYDVNLVSPDYPVIGAKIIPKPAPTPAEAAPTKQENDMLLISNPEGISLLSGNLYVLLDNIDTAHAIEATGVAHVDASAALHVLLVKASTTPQVAV